MEIHNFQNLLGTRYKTLPLLNVEYWMAPDSEIKEGREVWSAIKKATVFDESSLQIYIHVPFCFRNCLYCAFSGSNSKVFELVDPYFEMLKYQLKEQFIEHPMYGSKIRSVHIGGGSPNVLDTRIDELLRVLKDIPGFSEDTEISIEMELSTTSPEFMQALIDHKTTKISFGIQTVDPELRKAQRLPKSVERMMEVIEPAIGKIPIINADFLNALPGQSFQSVSNDMNFIFNSPLINAASVYLLEKTGSPELVASESSGKIKETVSEYEHAYCRLQSFAVFHQKNWVKKGMATFIDPTRVPKDVLNKLPGNESIGAQFYEDFLYSMGPSAKGYAPGVRTENTADISEWCQSIKDGNHGYFSQRCSFQHQYDIGFWLMPLCFKGLSKSRLNKMIEKQYVTEEQLAKLEQFVREGLIYEDNDRYQVSLIGEVFMGRISHDLKNSNRKEMIENYIDEGFKLGEELQKEDFNLSKAHEMNNRQLFSRS